jgi:hypothetical protein
VDTAGTDDFMSRFRFFPPKGVFKSLPPCQLLMDKHLILAKVLAKVFAKILAKA